MTAEEETAALGAENAALREQVQALPERVRELEGQLATDRHHGSKPPASDGLARRTTSLRQTSGKQPGGQRGHPGQQGRRAGLPAAVVGQRPARWWGSGQRALPDAAPRWVERRPVQELPLGRRRGTEPEIAPVRGRWCGATTKAQAPAGGGAPRHYGPRAWARWRP